MLPVCYVGVSFGPSRTARTKRRLLFIPLFFAAPGCSAFLRTARSDQVRAVRMLSKIATGMCLGVAFAHFKLILEERFWSRMGHGGVVPLGERFN
jgi:hypothetical protein